MRKLTFFLCLLCLLCSVPKSHARQAAKPPQTQPPQQQQTQLQPDKNDSFTLKIDTALVVENVIVKDKDGKDIEGLTEKDFVITEDNVPQTIGLFKFEKMVDTAAPAANTVAVPTEIIRPPVPTAITPLPSGDSRYDGRRLLVLFFDTMNTSPPDQLRAFTAADKFIRTQMKKPDLVAIMAFMSGSI